MGISRLFSFQTESSHSEYASCGASELLLALAEEEVKHKLRFKKEYDLLLK